MLVYAVRRLALAVFFVWLVSFGSFVAFGLSFDPLYQLNICLEQRCKLEKEMVTAQYHLHDPILQRYWYWLSGLIHHGFGSSVFPIPGSPTTAIDPALIGSAEVTAQLMAVGLVLTVLFSVLIGVTSARRPGGSIDGSLRTVAYLTWSLPTFLTGVLLYRWLGPLGWFYDHRAPGGGFLPWIRTITLPAVTLSLGLIGLYSRYVRTATLTELQRPYATVARAKGLSEIRMTIRHVLRNALGPFVSVLALDIGAIVGASLAADWVFQIGGLAGYFANSINHADPFRLTAVVVVIAAVVSVFMFLSDLALGWLDPRARAASFDRTS
jgi:peptide/nickel transport system permease protein